MEQVIKGGGEVYYEGVRYKSYDALYRALRSVYHREIGRASYLRLDRYGQRKERLHSHGFVFDAHNRERLTALFADRTNPVESYLLGIVDIGYVRSLGIWNYGDIRDDEFDDWLDWIYSRGNRLLRTRGLRSGYGRTSKRIKARYR